MKIAVYYFIIRNNEYEQKNCNESTEKILLWDNDNYSLYSKEQYKIDKVRQGLDEVLDNE